MRVIQLSILYLTALILFPIPQANAQFPIQDDPLVAKNAMQRKLLVVQLEPSKQEIKRSQKEGTYQKLLTQYQTRNETINGYYRKYWKNNNDIIPISEASLDSIKESKSPEYAYAVSAANVDTRTVEEYGKKRIRTYYYRSLYTGLTEHKTQPLGLMHSRGQYMTDLEFIFGINLMQYMINYIGEGRERKHLDDYINLSSAKIKTKTLLIPKAYADMSQSEMEEVYPYKIRIADKKEIMEVIEKRDSSYAVVILNHNSGSYGEKFNQFIMDCGSLEPLLLDKKSNIDLTNNDIDNIADDYIRDEFERRVKLIRAKNLRTYADMISQN